MSALSCSHCLSHKRKQPFSTLHIKVSWINLDPTSGMFLDMDAALFILCRTKDQLPYAGCCFWNFKSPFDLVVSIHAGVPLKLADEGLGATSSVSNCISSCPSLTFPSDFFSYGLPSETLKRHDRALNAETPKSAVSPVNICLPCSSLTGSSTVPLLPFVYFWHDKCFQLHLHRD